MSKQEIEARTGKPVLSIAYPTGGANAYSEQVLTCARQSGYRFAFTYEGGVNEPGTWDPYKVRRSAVERYSTRERFQASLAAPGIF
ncbi:MAG: polysaccharide deacetylase family protein [Aquabacterium sp.]